MSEDSSLPSVVAFILVNDDLSFLAWYNLIHSTYPDDLTEHQMHIIAYVVGYIVFILLRQLQCSVYSSWLSSS